MRLHLNRAITCIYFLVIIGSVSACTLSSNNNGDISPIHFLRVHGSINYFCNNPEQSNKCAIFFITKGNPDLKEGAVSLSFDSKYISVQDAEASIVLSQKKYTLWKLSFITKISSDEIEEDSITVTSANLNGTSYNDLGALKFQIIKGENSFVSPLELRSHAATAIGLGLKDYFASFRNSNPNPLTIIGVNIPGYEAAELQCMVYDDPGVNQSDVEPTLVGKYDLNKEKTKLTSGQIAELNVNLSNCSKTGIDVYYVSPIVKYETNGKDYQIALLPYISGVQITEKELFQIGESINWSN